MCYILSFLLEIEKLENTILIYYTYITPQHLQPRYVYPKYIDEKHFLKNFGVIARYRYF